MFLVAYFGKVFDDDDDGWGVEDGIQVLGQAIR